MLFYETIRIALAALRANKVRAMLTMLGIIIGVGAVITMMAVGQGARLSIEQQIVSMGLDRLNVWGGQRITPGGTRAYSPITLDDAWALRERMTFASAVVPETGSNYQVKYRNTNAELRVVASVPEYFSMNSATVVSGRIFNEGELSSIRLVAVLNQSNLEDLGATEAIIGDYIRIKGASFQVIGIINVTVGGMRGDPPAVFVPLTTVNARLSAVRSVQVSVQAVSENRVIDAAEEIERIIRSEHKLRPSDQNDFRIFNRLDLAQTFEQTAQTFSMLLASIAAVSLVVGGIGIMNIMLVSVTERTREIGIRKAIGAKRGTILLQFLLEAIVLCALGGLIGIALGAGAAYTLANQANWNAVVTMESIILAVAFSLCVGVFFGLYPALRAARLDPIEALRYE